MSDNLSYRDYRTLLRDAYIERRERDPKFSQGYIGSKLGTARTFFSMVPNSSTNFPPHHIDAVATPCGLREKEKRHFTLLVRFAHPRACEQKNHRYDQIMSFPEVEVEPLEREYREY